jgi:hypothetical protein
VFDVWPGWSNEPNRMGDPTGFFEVKIQALAQHASQLTEVGSGSSMSSCVRTRS